MAKIISIDGVGNVEFPDTMSDQDISTAIERDILKKAPAPSTTTLGHVEEFGKGVARGAWDTLGSGIAGLVRQPIPFTGEWFPETAKEISDWSGRQFKETLAPTKEPGYETTNKLGAALGSAGAFIGTALLTKGAGMGTKGALAATGALGMGTGVDEQAQRIEAAEKIGKAISSWDKRVALGAGSLIGLTEIIPVERALRVFQAAEKMGVMAPIGRMIGQALVEGGQEAAAGVLQNMVEKYGYNPEKQLWADFGENAGYGAFAGAATQAFFEGALPFKVRARLRELEEEKKAAIAKILEQDAANVKEAQRVAAEYDKIMESTRLQITYQPSTPLLPPAGTKTGEGFVATDAEADPLPATPILDIGPRPQEDPESFADRLVAEAGQDFIPGQWHLQKINDNGVERYSIVGPRNVPLARPIDTFPAAMRVFKRIKQLSVEREVQESYGKAAERMAGVRTANLLEAARQATTPTIFTADEMGTDVYAQVNSKRAEIGLPPLDAYTPDQLSDAGIPINQIRELREKINPTPKDERVVPNDIRALANQKNIDVDHPNFREYAKRVTGLADFERMGQEELVALKRSMDKLPILDRKVGIPLAPRDELKGEHYDRVLAHAFREGRVSTNVIGDALGLKRDKQGRLTPKSLQVARDMLEKMVDRGDVRPVVPFTERVRGDATVTREGTRPPNAQFDVKSQSWGERRKPEYELYRRYLPREQLPDGKVDYVIHKKPVTGANRSAFVVYERHTPEAGDPKKTSFPGRSDYNMTPVATFDDHGDASKYVADQQQIAAGRPSVEGKPLPGIQINMPGRFEKEAEAEKAAFKKSLSVDKNRWAALPERVRARLGAKMRARLEALGLGDTAVRVQEDLDSDGSFVPGLIKLAMVDEATMAELLDHEAIHALRRAGLFADPEWKALVKKAREAPHPLFLGKGKDGTNPSFWAAWRHTMLTSKQNPEYAAENQALQRSDPAAFNDRVDEESVAEMFRYWRKDPKPFVGQPGGLMSRIRKFFKALGDVMRGERNADVNEVLGKIASGEIGRRERLKPQGVESVPIHVRDRAGIQRGRPVAKKGPAKPPEAKAVPPQFERRTTKTLIFRNYIRDTGPQYAPIKQWYNFFLDTNMGLKDEALRTGVFHWLNDITEKRAERGGADSELTKATVLRWLDESIAKPIRIRDVMHAVKPQFAPGQSGLVPAVKTRDGRTLIGKPGQFHADVADEHGLRYNQVAESGFANASGEFLTRRQAAATLAPDDPVFESDPRSRERLEAVAYHYTRADVDHAEPESAPEKPGQMLAVKPEYDKLQWHPREGRVYPPPDYDVTKTMKDGDTILNQWSYIGEDPGKIENLAVHPQYDPVTEAGLAKFTQPVDIHIARTALNILHDPQHGFRGWRQRFRDFWIDARQKVVNRYESLGEQTRLLHKAGMISDEDVLADSGAMQAAIMSDRSAFFLSEAMRRGNIAWRRKPGGASYEGEAVIEETGVDGQHLDGLLKILAPIGERGNWAAFQYYAVAIRESRLQREARQRGETRATFLNDQELQAGMALGNAHPEFVEAFQQYQRWNEKLVQFMTDTGVIDETMRDKWVNTWDYIPLYREFDGETQQWGVFNSMTGVKPSKKTLGGKSPTAEFTETIIQNARAAITAGLKNVAAQRAMRDSVMMGNATRLPHFVKDMPGQVTIRENGKDVHYQVEDRLIYDAITGLDSPEPLVGWLFRRPAEILRGVVTKDPAFMAANLIRDTLSSWVTAARSPLPFLGTMNGLAKELMGSTSAQALRSRGVTGNIDFGSDIKVSGKHFRNQFDKGWLTKAWDKLERATEASDAATRIAIYESVLKKTGNQAQAAFEALEIMNFTRKGNYKWVRWLSAVVPFFNARMQGLDVLARAGFGGGFGYTARTDQAKMVRTFWTRAMFMLMMSLAYYQMVSDDDEWKNATPDERDNYWLIPMGGTTVRIPIPFEVGVLFKVIPERLAAAMDGNDNWRDFGQSMERSVTGSLGMNPIPQAAKPILEAVTNYSFFRGRPVEGSGTGELVPSERTTDSTSQMARMLGKMFDVSPIKIDYLINGYFPGISWLPLMAIDEGLRVANDAPVRAERRVEEYPVLRRFFQAEIPQGQVALFYDIRDKAREVARTVALMNRTGRFEEAMRLIQEEPGLFMHSRGLESMARNMGELRAMRKMIENDKSMSPADKRERIDSIKKMENQLAALGRSMRNQVYQ